MEEDLNKDISDYIATLDPVLQWSLMSDESIAVYNDIANRYKLSEKGRTALINETTYILLGLAPPARFAENLRESEDFDKDTVERIAIEVNAVMFVPVLDLLTKLRDDLEKENMSVPQEQLEAPIPKKAPSAVVDAEQEKLRRITERIADRNGLNTGQRQKLVSIIENTRSESEPGGNLRNSIQNELGVTEQTARNISDQVKTFILLKSEALKESGMSNKMNTKTDLRDTSEVHNMNFPKNQPEPVNQRETKDEDSNSVRVSEGAFKEKLKKFRSTDEPVEKLGEVEGGRPDDQYRETFE